MKMILISTVLLYTFNLFAETICAPSPADGGSSRLCSPILSERTCNSQGQDGLACFWINYGNEGANGACTSAINGFEEFCSQIINGNLCSMDPKCSWAGINSEMPDYNEEVDNSANGVCGALTRENQNTCSSILSRITCGWNSSCSWVWL